MIGSVLGHYRIVAKLGAGGMGVVWRARDERLGRDVALKLLPDELVADAAARARMLREARTASALNHPNILTIHEVGEAGGHVYIATEFVPGQPLADLMGAEGLPVETVIRYGAQIADALVHAHERGVVHRDIKASNVLITPEGRVKVLDFGLARLETAGPDGSQAMTLTSPGVLMGTPAALAPELWRGAPADVRSDLWALGVLLHQMLSGAGPFRGTTMFELSAAILEQPPAPLPARVPAGLAAVVNRCLMKDPSQRWRSAAEVRAALEALGAAHAPAGAAASATSARHGPKLALPLALGALALAALAAAVVLMPNGLRSRLAGRGVGRVESIAVLPLDNFSKDPDQLYFADGITEELTTRLAQLGALRVISRTSVMRFRGSKESLPAIAKQLGVDAVIEGSVERSGDRVRITAQLVRAATDEHLWARSYERDMKDALALQDEVAGAIVAEIQGALAPRSPAAREPARSVDPAVYQAYLRGRAQYERWDSPSIHRALASYDRALAMDSTYAPAHAARAQALQLLSNTADTLALARASLERALALDPNLSEAHASLAQMLFYNDWKWAEAGREFKRAIELNPNNSDAHHQYAHWLMAQGRVAESVEQSRIGLRLDPLSPSVIAHMAWTSYMTGRFEDVPAYVRQALEIDPSYSSAQDDLVMTELARRRWPEWEDALRRAQQLGEPVDSLSYAVARAARAGRHDEALRLVQAMESPKDSVPHLPTELAAMYLALGRPDDAFAALERGLAQRSFDVIYVGTDPAFKELRSDPRMMALRRRMGLAS